jgi:iron complex outermembrane receptor protein
MRRHLLTSSALVLACVAQAALAQDDAGAASAPPEQSQDVAADGGLDVITVTAQRREETLQDAAIAINAATGEDLIATGVVDASQLNKVAPALYVSAGGGANVGYFVRGVGNFVNNGFTNPAVAFNIDGVYVGRPSSTVAAFLDLNRVEVLKGPQGTLYGRNATGGAINVIPNVPQFNRFEGSVSGQYGNYDAWELTGVVNVPLGGDLAMRFAATTSQRDGYFSDGTGSSEDLALRGQIRAALGDAVEARVSVDYSTQKGTGPGLNVDGVYTFTPFSPGATVPNWTFRPAPANVTAPYTGLHAPQTLAFIQTNATAAPLFSPLSGYAYPFRDDEYFGINGELKADLGGIELVIIPAYRRSELDNQFNGPPFKAAINQDVAKQYSVEARLSGETGPVEWILGGYWFDENVKGLNSFNQFATTTYNDFDYDSESLAAFARATLSVTDDLRLVGGIRYTDESRSIDALPVATTAVCLIEPVAGPPSCAHVPTIPVGLTLADSVAQLDPALFPAGSPLTRPSPYGAFPYGPFGPTGPQALWINTPTVIDRTSGDEEITWRAAVEYDLTPDNLLYASFETGFRAGGFNTTFGQEEYDPEFIDAWTIGSKNSFFNNRLQLNLEAFWWEYTGQQLAALGVDGNGNNSFFTRNVGESSVKGVEVDFQVLATPTTRIYGGVQYLDATYDSFQYNQVDLSDATDPPNFLTPVTGCAYSQVMTPRRSFDIDCSGMPALYAPDWTVNLGIEQLIDTPIGEFVANLGGRYRSDRVIGFHYLPTGNSGDDLVMDASLSYAPFDSGLTITAFVRNFTDEAVQATYQIGAGNVTSSAYEPPRTYGVRASFNF